MHCKVQCCFSSLATVQKAIPKDVQLKVLSQLKQHWCISVAFIVVSQVTYMRVYIRPATGSHFSLLQ